MDAPSKLNFLTARRAVFYAAIGAQGDSTSFTKWNRTSGSVPDSPTHVNSGPPTGALIAESCSSRDGYECASATLGQQK